MLPAIQRPRRGSSRRVCSLPALLWPLFLVCVSLLASVAPCVAQFTAGAFGFFGAGNDQYDFSHCLDGSGSGSVFATGSTDGALLGQSAVGSGSYDWVVLKFDKNNGFLTRNTNNPLLRFLATPTIDAGHSCVSDTAGSVYVAGVSNGNLFASPCGRDTVVAKYDNNLNLLWGVQLDVGKVCYDDWAMKVLLYGSVLYVVGNAQRNGSPNYTPYILALNTADGSQVWSSAVFYGAVANIYVGVREATVDPNGNLAIVGAWSNAAIPASHTLNGTVIPGLPGGATYVSGYVAGFDSAGNLRWQQQNAAGSYSGMFGVTTDVTGAVYAAGYVEGSVHGAPYLPTSVGDALPLLQKLDVNGNILWTVLYPAYDSQVATRVVTDNIGGVYWLIGFYTCAGSYSSSYAYLDTDYSCASASQSLYLLKSDVNGAVQFADTTFSSGIAQALTIDNTGLLTLSGDITTTLHGASSGVAGYNGFIDQQSINYNCSCNNLASLVAQMSALLNITTS